MIESLLGDIDPSFTSAKTSKTTSNTPSFTPSKPLTTTNKGKDSTTSVVSDDEGEGETFSDWLSSLEASGGVTRGGGGPMRESFDRIDSERVLDDLMRELDTTSSSSSSNNNSYKPTDNNDRRSKRVEVPSIEAWGSSSTSSSSDISEVYSNTYDNLASQLSGTVISIDDLLGPTPAVPAIDPGTGALSTSISLNAGKKVWTPKSSSSTTTTTAAYTTVPTSSTADKKNTYNKPTSPSPFTTSAGAGAAPDMEQYPDFEAYIAAVLEYEQNGKGVSSSSTGITTEKGQNYDPFDDDIVVVKKETVADDQYDKSNYIYDKNDGTNSNSNNRNNKYTKAAPSAAVVTAAADDYFIDESYSSTSTPTTSNSASASASGGGGSDDEFFADFLDEFYASSSPSDSSSDVKTKTIPITNTEPVATSRPIKAAIKTSLSTSAVATETSTSISFPETSVTSTLQSTSQPATKVTTSSSSSSSSNTNTDNNNTTNNEYITMTVVALKQMLKDKGLKISGTKTELINRLIES